MRQAYQVRLADLGDHGYLMCQLTSTALRDATKALLNADLALAEQVIASDVRLDSMRANAEQVAFELLALEAPVATDLRAVVSAMWIVADLQRMGALAIHVAKAARRRHPAHVIPVGVRPIIERMGRVGVHLADQAGLVLRERNLELARRLEVEDDLMDDLQRELFTLMLAPEWDNGVGPAVDIALLSRFYERFADHAVAVARRVVFLVTGENVGGDTTPAEGNYAPES
ncbi:phosphate signaling complex protein PhoU [Nakamurella flava]|uniref:Phosphate-specific transport system accessory protein PhoU n=1 Tax=Nakamurella flava TaxID=2576308 RepID=A0A4U6QCB4_9ACTN|nr:phosphate signaling complex protein PhoU [Nakamurella flava]TKV57651.1 phosphate signaling complex protein PhoU [Nakamurella flava]